MIHGRLKIADRLLSIGLTCDASYQLCAGGVESHKNLFFKCDYAKKCLDIMKAWRGVKNYELQFQRMALLWRKNSRSSFQKKVIADVIVALALYDLVG